MKVNKPQLPRHYWPFLIVGLLNAFLVGAMVGAVFDVNSYITGTIVYGVMVLREVIYLKRHGYIDD